MLIFQLLNDPGLGHCNRIISFVKKHFYRENSIILVPESSDVIRYLETQNICNILKYDTNKNSNEIIDLVNQKVKIDVRKIMPNIFN